ncbi:single-stranded-DNA-specific exonuclease RecJ [Patescibacteria group bacterium]|nr:single-stranded-DNA-specific exonuclease RecJ [Patescibacteria group bacterium]
MPNKKWNIQAEYKKGDLVKQLLKNRDIKNTGEFINIPSIGYYINNLKPVLKTSLGKAKKVIQDSIEKKDTIIVYGDYDADGISATAIFISYLRNELRYKNTHYFIPNRFEHGYGLSKAGIEKCLNLYDIEKTQDVLWVTVDTGITANEEIEYLKSLSHRVVLTDHHQKPKILPPSDVVVWSDEVVGATLSWLVVKFLGSKNNQNLSLAALATVTDLQPLMGFNRSIVKSGLEILNKKPPIGIQKLLQVSGRNNGEVATYDLGWVIGPRINALGRLGDAEEAVELLLATDTKKAEELAVKLNSINIERQDKTMEMYELTTELDEKELPHIIFSTHDNYHEGIIGLVAARLVQKYYRPSIVISLDGDFGKGSVRSIPGINIIETLREFEHLFENVGGHPMAAGFTIHRDNIDELEDEMVKYAQVNFPSDLFVPVLDIDMKIPAKVINLELLDEIDKLKPYGIGNAQPVFLTADFGVAGVDWVGRENNHLLLKLFDGKDFLKAIYFNFNSDKNDYIPQIGDKIDVVYSLKRNEYNGKTNIDLVVKDIRMSEPSIDSE